MCCAVGQKDDDPVVARHMPNVPKTSGMKNKVLNIISAGFTAFGVILLILGDLTNGLLALILGELIDIPKERISLVPKPDNV